MDCNAWRPGTGDRVDLDDAAALLLAPSRLELQRCEHRVSCQGCMADESRFATRREEPQPQVVICSIRPQQECGVAIVQLARERLHVLAGERVGLEYHAGRIASEAP